MEQSELQRIDLALYISKVVVAFNDLDLFLKGYYQIKENTDDEKFNDIGFVKSIFLDRSGKWFDTFDFKKQFNCGYGGNGPGNYLRFLLKYTDRNQEELQNAIYNNPVVTYDFTKQEIITEESYLEDGSLDIKASKDGKLIFFVENTFNRIHSNDELANEIILINQVMNSIKNKMNRVTNILYIGDNVMCPLVKTQKLIF